MFDPVWLGNHIVARWEAFGLVAATGALAVLVLFAACWIAVWACKRIDL